MLDANKLKADILEDLRVDLSDEFDRNFECKGFFSDKWKSRAVATHGHNDPHISDALAVFELLLPMQK